MEIKEHRLSSFIDLYEKQFGVRLSMSEAHAKASMLMQYVLLFMKPLAKAEEDDINKMPD